MLFDEGAWAGLADGSITLTFRRWSRPHAKAGSLHRTPVGVLRIDNVGLVEAAGIDDDDAVRAGWASAADLRTWLGRAGEGPVYRVAFHLEGQDSRTALRNTATFTDAEWSALTTRLDRWDARAEGGAWTLDTLRLIAGHPGERAADLAARAGRERDPFKADVRKLKELGLTESLEVGYRLSPRGEAALGRLQD